MFDAVIIGGGPAGYSCALRVAELGGKAVVIEEKHVGGTCTNVGCVPTKALISSVAVLRKIREAGVHGITVSEPTIDYSVMKKRADAMTVRFRRGVELLLKNAGIELVNARGTIKSKGIVDAAKREFHAKNIVIATGSRPAMLQGMPFGSFVISSDDFLASETLPSSIAIVGGGVMGVEFGSLLSALGAKTAIIEAGPAILPSENADVSKFLASTLSRNGVEIITGSPVSAIDAEKKVVLVAGREIGAEKVLVCVGRVPNFDREEMDGLGVKYARAISVHERLQTSVPNVYAVGDVKGAPMYAYTAAREGEVAAENIMGMDSTIDYSAVPNVIFSEPEIASVGQTVESAGVVTGKFDFTASAKAHALGDKRGFFEVFLKDGKIVGACVIGPHATELIAEATLAVKLKLDASQITSTFHGHPVLYEGFAEAVKAALHKAK